MALTYYEYQALVVALSWIIGFAPVWLGWRAPFGGGRFSRWRWWQAVGLALVVSPFVRMGINVYYDLTALIVTTISGEYVVLQAIPRSVLWARVWRQTLYYLLVPACGLLLMWGGRPRRRDLDDAGLVTREGAWRDTLNGLTLFVFITVAYVGSMVLAYVVLRDILVSTGDESRVWANITPVLIVLLSGLAGLTEEFLFRGLLLRALGKAMPFVAAAFVQAALFGLVHAGYMTWAHVVGPFAFGLGMAWIVRVLGLIPAMLLHAQVNVAFFAFDVADVQPGAWWLLAALALANVYAAWATRLAAVRLLWASLTGAFRRRPRRAAPA